MPNSERGLRRIHLHHYLRRRHRIMEKMIKNHHRKIVTNQGYQNVQIVFPILIYVITITIGKTGIKNVQNSSRLHHHP